ncbi:hypothetical protein, partial [Dactylosporangium maewongense]|uniref:hypothetical protein n=1 Tax=Dactylosporangium maewongense TaxID=634393 RepID=UPI0031E443CA
RSSLDLSFGTFVSSKDQAVTVSISSTTSKVGDSYTTPVDMTPRRRSSGRTDTKPAMTGPRRRPPNCRIAAPNNPVAATSRTA